MIQFSKISFNILVALILFYQAGGYAAKEVGYKKRSVKDFKKTANIENWKRRAVKKDCYDRYGVQLKTAVGALKKQKQALRVQLIEDRKKLFSEDKKSQKLVKELADLRKLQGKKVTKEGKRQARMERLAKSKLLTARNKALAGNPELQAKKKQLASLEKQVEDKTVEILHNDKACREVLLTKKGPRVAVKNNQVKKQK